MTAVHAVMSSPIGLLTLVAGGGALTAVSMENHKRGPAAGSLGTAIVLYASAPEQAAAGSAGEDAAVLLRTQVQLGEYFAGERWNSICRWRRLAIRSGGGSGHCCAKSRTDRRPYGDLARQLGDRNLAQAVGAASARNPISVIVPCHRVVGPAGQLTGYAGGLDRKHFLLGLEDPRRAQGALFYSAGVIPRATDKHFPVASGRPMLPGSQALPRGFPREGIQIVLPMVKQ